MYYSLNDLCLFAKNYTMTNILFLVIKYTLVWQLININVLMWWEEAIIG